VKGSALASDYNPFMRFIWNYAMPMFRFVSSAIRSTKQSGNDLAQLVLNEAVVQLSCGTGAAKGWIG